MTAQLLISELTAITQESKRKNADLRNAAEQSLQDIKNLPNTSEAQLAADLRRRPGFIRPFLLACNARNPKFAGNSIICLQRLIVSNGLSQESVQGVLEALRECSSLGIDVQLKILQALPSLLQNYADCLNGELLQNVLQVCFLLFGSKTSVVSSTAAATLQQLLVSILEKVSSEDASQKSLEPVIVISINDESVSLRNAALDAYTLLNDLCLVTEGQRPKSLASASISQSFGLELIESMVAGHADTVSSHPELISVIRLKLMPSLIKIISERVSFPTTVRAMRLLPIILGPMLSVLPSECEVVLSLLNHMLDQDAAVPWKRALCLEVYRTIHAEPALVRSIYTTFDEVDGRRNIVRDHLSSLVRLSGEKPAVIGLGHQSSIPASDSQTEDDSNEQAALQAGGVAGVIGIAVTVKSSMAPGISVQWSSMRVPCIDQLDKSEAPSIPPAYVYTLALTCINSFSEGLARFLLPFTMPSDIKGKRKGRPSQAVEAEKEANVNSGDDGPVEERRCVVESQPFQGAKQPVNPLSLEKHVLYQQIRISAKMIETCWPAVLAASSTFLNAALDTHYYHALVRSFQKFTQVAGLLRLVTPRDAFLTTMGKNGVPPAVISAHSIANLTGPTSDRPGPKGRTNSLNMSEMSLTSSMAGSSDVSRQSLDATNAQLSTRNLLCLRALLNLGIALGPVLGEGWSIVLETLQQADMIISQSPGLKRQQAGSGVRKSNSMSNGTDANDYGSEISAVEIAATRMLESTVDLSDRAFSDFIVCLKGLLSELDGLSEPKTHLTKDELSLALPNVQHRRTSSYTPSGFTAVHTDQRGNSFVIETIGRLVDFNTERILLGDPLQSGWALVTDLLVDIVDVQISDSEVRMKASTILSNIVETTSSPTIPAESKDEVRRRGLLIMSSQVDILHRHVNMQSKILQTCDTDIHRLLLTTLRAVLEQYGDSLIDGWRVVFHVLASVFVDPSSGAGNVFSSHDFERPRVVHAKSANLVRISFASVQLICSDFLASIPQSCIRTLLSNLHSFCAQQDDFNISLASTTLFWNISDYLWDGRDNLSLVHFLQADRNGQEKLDEVGAEESVADLWVFLLLSLVNVTTDPRLEIRHGAIHTVFQIFEAFGRKLQPGDWIVCQDMVILRMLMANNRCYDHERNLDVQTQHETLRAWNETVIVLLHGISGVYSRYLRVILPHPIYEKKWTLFMNELQNLLDRKTFSVDAAVYSTLSKSLACCERGGSNVDRLMQPIWTLWQNDNPVKKRTVVTQGSRDSERFFLAYLRCLADMLRLSTDDVTLDQVKVVLQQLRTCLQGSNTDGYVADLDTLTGFQSQTLECIGLIHADKKGVPTEIIRCLAFFVKFAFDQRHDSTGTRTPTFIAFSKSAMGMLKDYCLKFMNEEDVYISGALTNAVESLAVPIEFKYKWKLEGKKPSTWSKSTNVVIPLLTAAIPVVRTHEKSDQEISLFWTAVNRICLGIISALDSSDIAPTQIADDEVFDIRAYSEVRDLITPSLGSADIEDIVRRDYTKAIFKYSIIHEPHPDDLPRSGEELLQALKSVHIGRVQNLPPSPREKMSYVLLDELFDLVAVHDSSLERIKLAQAAAPYLILRTGLVIKAYVLDQPLRGRMPAPNSQRRELLHVLRKLVQLRSEPMAIPDAPGVTSRFRKHLHRLYFLVLKASGISRKDEEIQQAFAAVLGAVGQDFGIP